MIPEEWNAKLFFTNDLKAVWMATAAEAMFSQMKKMKNSGAAECRTTWGASCIGGLIKRTRDKRFLFFGQTMRCPEWVRAHTEDAFNPR